MIKVIELRKSIAAFLKSVHPRVYFQTAPEEAAYPYIVYDLPNSIDDGSMEHFIFDVDGWDAPIKGDTTDLETLMHDIDSALHRKTAMIAGMSATFYRENRLSLTDDDPRIRRRKYVYQVRTHEIRRV